MLEIEHKKDEQRRQDEEARELRLIKMHEHQNLQFLGDNRARMEKEQEIKEKELLLKNKLDSRLKKALGIVKDSLYPMPTVPSDLPAYFEQIERTFAILEIDDDLKYLLLAPHLTSDARKTISENPAVVTFDEAKALILRTNKLSPAKYRDMFTQAEKLNKETYAQYVNRLSINLSYYVKSREVDGDYNNLFNLLVCDRLKEGLVGKLRDEVRISEKGGSKTFCQIAEHLDVYVSEAIDFETKPNTYNSNTNNYTKGFNNNATNKKFVKPLEEHTFKNSNPGTYRQVEQYNTGGRDTQREQLSPRGTSLDTTLHSPKRYLGKTPYPPCPHCNFPTPSHSPESCYKNPNSSQTIPKKTMRIGIQSVQAINKSQNFDNEYLQSVKNNTQGFADNSKCVNSDSFDLNGLFNEDPSELNIAHMILDNTDIDDDDKIILKTIPSSCRTVLNFGGGNVDTLIDTGAEITCVRPEYLPKNKIQPLAKIKLSGAYASQGTAEAVLTNIECRIVDGGGDYPFYNIQVAVVDKLTQPCCLSFNDYKILSEISLTVALILTDWTVLLDGSVLHKNEILELGSSLKLPSNTDRLERYFLIQLNNYQIDKLALTYRCIHKQ